MKKPFLITSVSILAIAIIATVKIAPESEISVTKRIATENRESYVYTVRENGGKIAVYEKDNPTPLYYLEDVVVKTLPEYDRVLLKSGIKVKNDKELQKVLEDYDS